LNGKCFNQKFAAKFFQQKFFNRKFSTNNFQPKIFNNFFYRIFIIRKVFIAFLAAEAVLVPRRLLRYDLLHLEDLLTAGTAVA
jgi:hypothetical protein